VNDHIILNPDPRAMPFGRYLKAIRVQQGISIEEVAYETQISIRKLMLIEDEDHEQLPEKDQVQALLRDYARWLGVDEDDIVDRYEINRSFFYQTENSDSEAPLKHNKRSFLRFFLALVVLIAVVGLSAYAYFYYQPNFAKSADNVLSEAISDVNAESADDAQPEEVEPVAIEEAADPSVDVAPPAQTAKLFLKIDAVEETMIKIGVDDAELVAYLLNPKDHIELEALNRIRMEVGNPDGVNVLLNNEPVAITGQNGEIVTLELTHPK